MATAMPPRCPVTLLQVVLLLTVPSPGAQRSASEEPSCSKIRLPQSCGLCHLPPPSRAPGSCQGASCPDEAPTGGEQSPGWRSQDVAAASANHGVCDLGLGPCGAKCRNGELGSSWEQFLSFYRFRSSIRDTSAA